MSNSLEASAEPLGSRPAFRLVQAGPRRLCLRGELDIAGAPDVLDRLAGLPGDVELDCSGVRFIDASGLRLLVAARRCYEARGAKLTIVDPSPCVVRLLALSGLDFALAVRPNSSVP